MNNNTSKTTIPKLFKYERAALLSERAAQIADGSPLTIQNYDSTNPVEIALEELNQRKIPLKVMRRLQDGKIEEWDIRDFITIN